MLVFRLIDARGTVLKEGQARALKLATPEMRHIHAAVCERLRARAEGANRKS